MTSAATPPPSVPGRPGAAAGRPVPDRRAVVLVEGVSDREAVLAAARGRGRDLAAEGVEVVAMGGAAGVRRCLVAVRDATPGIAVRGLYDVAEEGFFRRALGVPGRAELAAAGFFACVADLEDELIRAVGVPGVEAVVAEHSEQRALATLRRQPAQRDRPPAVLLHRFLGTTSGRKARYARALVERLDPPALPPPLRRLLDTV
ncbi:MULTISPECIES: TOPRIM nucleotidyl transferase/hydrolase domain-containing protein [unclassified Blastococcus]